MRARVTGAALLALGLAATGCGSGSGGSASKTLRPASLPLLADRYVRPPRAKTDMDTNAANLASAVVTYNFGQLPEYIDAAGFRLLPHDLEQRAAPGETRRIRYRLTVPRTTLVLDTVVTSGLTLADVRDQARSYSVSVALDGRYVRAPRRFWVFYRNNGPQICRIYFPGDLGSLSMGANSLVLRPLAPGRHRLVSTMRERVTATLPPATIVSTYDLRVLPRGPTAAERARAPREDGAPPATNRTPLTFRTPQS